mmetsp:Transcript_18138/g.50098  ORF Transcript_18138/g.50098 Transcript_18138/m.50098 type:complete len:342 (-) Transcript_18138:959-1984(-)
MSPLASGTLSRAHRMLADRSVESRNGADLLLLQPKPAAYALSGESHRCHDHEHEDAEDNHALEREWVLWLLAKPRPLQDAGVFGEAHLEAALILSRLAEHAHAVLVNRDRPILHLAIHEGARGELHPCHEFVQIERGLKVERHNVVIASARVAVLHRQAAERIGVRLRGIARAFTHSNGQVRLPERYVDGTSLLPWLLRQDLHCRLRGHTVRRHLRGERLLHGAGNVHQARHGFLNEIGQVLAVVAIEANTLKPAEEHGSLVLPIRWKGFLLQYHAREHHVAHVVPDACVHELHPPLLGQVGADLVADLFTALVDEIGQVLPSDLVGINVEDATRCRHIPS